MPYELDREACRDLQISIKREWLLTNGLGGFAMGTVSGINTRRYHGLLVAAVEPPATRMVLLQAMECEVNVNGKSVGIGTNQYPGAIFPTGYTLLNRFSVDGIAEWEFVDTDFKVVRRLALQQSQNACTIEYINRGSSTIQLVVRPLICHKPYHENFYEQPDYPRDVSFQRDRSVITHHGIPLVLSHRNAEVVPVVGWYYRFEHAIESERGLPSRDDLFCPCELRYRLKPGESAVIGASTDLDAVPLALPAAGDEIGGSLRDRLASSAKHFLVSTVSRQSIIAGYPWFTDWGRDTMISIPGICLHTGEVPAARRILTDFAGQMRQGLLPNRFVDSGEPPEYNTVDATLWFVNAAYKTLLAKWDKTFASQMLKVLAEIYQWHVRGTLYGIKVDPKDGLLSQGEPGIQLTWMDAKIGDWVVTPRHGKPVEVNGLWINALRIMEWVAKEVGDKSAEDYGKAASFAEGNFDSKFWAKSRGHYLDTADPDDASFRPNQVIAMALPFGPATGEHARRALVAVKQELLTPRGLRTLGNTQPGYEGRYRGPLKELDAAYHQGTVWPWLLGSYVSAYKRVFGQVDDLRWLLPEMEAMLSEGGLGGIAEVYDGDEPRSPGGCPWQAWSVAELLRTLVEDFEEPGSKA